jgi:putative PIG3 family NAD(P)H quinone oxidoreductase
MRAITTDGFGGLEVIRWAEVPDPKVAPGEVLIDVAASAVNRLDLLQRQGHYDPPPGASEILGVECSGRIAELGHGVSGWWVGDEVCALLDGGGYAERVAVAADRLLPVPNGVALVSAAALPEVACTVWDNVFRVGRAVADETLLVHGGASGIGTMAIQLARRAGVRVIVTAGSAAKLARCADLGAEGLINYREEDFVERVRSLTDGRGVDVILDNMGAKYLGRNVDALTTCGRLVVIGLQGGLRAELDLGMLLAKRGSVAATSLRRRTPREKAAVVADVVANVWPAIEAGEVRPVIDRVLPLHDAAVAHRVVTASEHVGKVVLAV